MANGIPAPSEVRAAIDQLADAPDLVPAKVPLWVAAEFGKANESFAGSLGTQVTYWACHLRVECCLKLPSPSPLDGIRL